MIQTWREGEESFLRFRGRDVAAHVDVVRVRRDDAIRALLRLAHGPRASIGSYLLFFLFSRNCHAVFKPGMPRLSDRCRAGRSLSVPTERQGGHAFFPQGLRHQTWLRRPSRRPRQGQTHTVTMFQQPRFAWSLGTRAPSHQVGAAWAFGNRRLNKTMGPRGRYCLLVTGARRGISSRLPRSGTGSTRKVQRTFNDLPAQAHVGGPTLPATVEPRPPISVNLQIKDGWALLYLIGRWGRDLARDNPPHTWLANLRGKWTGSAPPEPTPRHPPPNLSPHPQSNTRRAKKRPAKGRVTAKRQDARSTKKNHRG